MYRLQNLGADFNGVIMLSTLLNWATTQPGLDQGYINLLPSYAAAAWYHGKARPADQPLTGFLDGAREFAPLQVPNVALDLSAAMRRNPALRVYIMGGVYDLATPFAGAEFDISHLYLSERLRRNVQFSWYESGHMTFVDEKVIPVMTSDLARFYASAPEQVG